MVRAPGMAVVCLAAILIGCQSDRAGHSYKPDGGYIASGDIAIAVARVYLSSIYGNEQIAAQEPLVAYEKGETWIVKGVFHHAQYKRGGVAEICLDKDSGAVLNVTHGR